MLNTYIVCTNKKNRNDNLFMAAQVNRLARLFTPFYASKINAQVVYPATSVIVKPNELESALCRPIHASFYESDRTPIYYAVQLSYGIVMGHPFLDGNKRTGMRLYALPSFFSVN